MRSDPAGGRTLSSAAFTNATGMTIESCVGFCNDQSYVYAGTEYGQECCATIVSTKSDPIPDVFSILRLWQ